jgi:hypothetical protein
MIRNVSLYLALDLSVPIKKFEICSESDTEIQDLLVFAFFIFSAQGTNRDVVNFMCSTVNHSIDH